VDRQKGGVVSMRTGLEQFPSIPESDRLALASATHLIEDTDQLLESACTPARIHALAETTRIPFTRLARYASLADLVRVKGVGPALAELLVSALAVATVHELANADPVILHEKLAAFQSESDSGLRMPSLEELRQACSEARELRPRLSLHREAYDPHFRQKLFQEAWKSRKRMFRPTLGSIAGMFILPVGLILAVIYLYLVPNSPRPISAYPQINQIIWTAQRLNYDLLAYSTLAIAVLLLGVALILLGIYALFIYFGDTWLVLLLFNSPALHKVFEKVIMQEGKKGQGKKIGKDEKKSKGEKNPSRALWWVVGTFAILFLAVTGMALYMILIQSASSSAVLAEIAKFIIPGGVLIATAAFLPELRYTLSLTREEMVPEDAVKRICVYRMYNLLPLLVLIGLLVKVLVPLTITWHTCLYQDRLVPAVTQQFMQKGQQLRHMVSTDTKMEETRKFAIWMVEVSMPDKMQTLASESITNNLTDINSGITAALNMVVWIVLTAFLMYFVVPYLMLGGWKRGLFYMIVIGLSYWIGELFVENAPAWFALPEKSGSRFLVAAFFVFITTLFFDWIFGLVVNRRKVCPACQSEQPAESHYCSQCGFQQE
jgi:type IV secretory pathway VirB2 component (pilin)